MQIEPVNKITNEQKDKALVPLTLSFLGMFFEIVKLGLYEKGTKFQKIFFLKFDIPQ